MSWFTNKRLEKEHDDTEKKKQIEIVAHKDAAQEVVDQVKQVNDTINSLFKDNHFSLTIYLAAGGVASDKLTTKEPGQTPKKWKRDK